MLIGNSISMLQRKTVTSTIKKPHFPWTTLKTDMATPKQWHKVTDKHSVIPQNTVTSSPTLWKPQIT